MGKFRVGLMMVGAVFVMNDMAAQPVNSSSAIAIPAYYRLSQPVTAQYIFPDCADPAEAALKEQCSLIAQRMDFLETKLKGLCSNAGESILRTVENVQGVYVKSPKNSTYGYFHEMDTAWEIFIAPALSPHYKYWEYDRSWQGYKIQNCRYEFEPQPLGRPKTHTVCKGLVEPESSYGITWQQLTSDSEQNQESIFGDELTINNLNTNEILATRRFYYYVIRDNQIASGSGRYIRTPGINNTFRTFIRACSNYSPKESVAYNDQRPRDSSEFFSRVLIPARKSKGPGSN